MNDTKIIKSITVATGKAFQVNEEKLLLPSGKEVERTVVRHSGSVIILPILPDGRLFVIHQYRHTLGDFILEFPAGTMEEGEDPLACAKRELIEESQHAASDWVDLGMQYPAPGFCDEKQYCYLARGLSPQVGEMDEDEIIEGRAFTVAEVELAVRNKEMVDAKSLAVFLKARVGGLL